MNDNSKNVNTATDDKLKENVKLMRVMSVISIICSVGGIVFALLQIFGVMNNAVFVYMPLMGVTMLTQTVRFWRTKSHAVAVYSLIVAVLIFAVTVFNILVRIA